MTFIKIHNSKQFHVDYMEYWLENANILQEIAEARGLKDHQMAGFTHMKSGQCSWVIYLGQRDGALRNQNCSFVMECCENSPLVS